MLQKCRVGISLSFDTLKPLSPFYCLGIKLGAKIKIKSNDLRRYKMTLVTKKLSMMGLGWRC